MGKMWDELGEKKEDYQNLLNEEICIKNNKTIIHHQKNRSLEIIVTITH